MTAIVPYSAKTINNNLPVLAFDKSKIRLIENHLFVKKMIARVLWVSGDWWNGFDKVQIVTTIYVFYTGFEIFLGYFSNQIIVIFNI
ncbi:hypothetical protein [Flavihumibacter profundi]|jgi:hypothetical protein|uniref:hypothetical protein n=1 Tax=Flavihumibacter profundi TaxID=2716883 RepID=UPI001CC5DE03|nr:hypothetical protein [Flavihumibacter profundi]MBZ5856353.1 hypothetical protein [Flavihumibacter profundi]